MCKNKAEFDSREDGLQPEWELLAEMTEKREVF